MNLKKSQSNFLEYKSSNVDKGRRKYGSSQSIFVDFFVTMSSSISCICCIGFFSSSYCRTNMPIISQTHSPYISMAPTSENIFQIFGKITTISKFAKCLYPKGNPRIQSRFGNSGDLVTHFNVLYHCKINYIALLSQFF